ncbi:hypothetical protein [Nocardia sp. NPDC003183]
MTTEVLRYRPRTLMATSELYVIARLDFGDAAADLYSSEVYCDHADDGAISASTTASWSRSLPLAPNMPTDLDGLDRTLATAGYYRTGDWRVRVTASGAVRYFADATSGHRGADDRHLDHPQPRLDFGRPVR